MKYESPYLNNEGQINSFQMVQEIKSIPPQDIINTAFEISDCIKNKNLQPKQLIATAFQELEQENSSSEQAHILTFLFLLEGKANLHEETDNFLEDLSIVHSYKNEFSTPFKRFISERLRIETKAHRKIENSEETKHMLILLKNNNNFFHDIVKIQNYFTQKVSPVMPLNSTWNPLLTEKFKLKGIEGLWYIYANNKSVDYVELMKQQMTSEWTGFNRFNNEPWDNIRKFVNKQGHLIDIGGSIGISAIEIANALQMLGPIIILDYHNPLRQISSLRIIDYANPESRLISITEASSRIDAIKENRVLMTLFGIDFGMPLSDDVKSLINNSAFVHCGNVLPYLPLIDFNQAIKNNIEATSPSGGILKIHNDESLPLDNILSSITLQRQENRLHVLSDLLKTKY